MITHQETIEEQGVTIRELRRNVERYRAITRCPVDTSLDAHLLYMTNQLDSHEQNSRTPANSDGAIEDSSPT